MLDKNEANGRTGRMPKQTKQTKQEKAEALYRARKVEHIDDLTIFAVAGSQGKSYEAYYDRPFGVWECECEDFRRHTRGDHTYACKHIIAAALMRHDLVEAQVAL